jgi:hypothetical protein
LCPGFPNSAFGFIYLRLLFGRHSIVALCWNFSALLQFVDVGCNYALPRTLMSMIPLSEMSFLLLFASLSSRKS